MTDADYMQFMTFAHVLIVFLMGLILLVALSPPKNPPTEKPKTRKKAHRKVRNRTKGGS